jgi:PleD family two-component response regulator
MTKSSVRLAKHDMPPIRLLIAGDDSAVRSHLEDVSRRHGITTAVAGNAHQLPAVVTKFRPTHVFVSALSEELAGVECLLALSRLRCQAEIIVSGTADDRFSKAIQRFGASYGLRICGILTEPVSESALSELLALPNQNALT